jgi:hypothetical protein
MYSEVLSVVLPHVLNFYTFLSFLIIIVAHCKPHVIFPIFNYYNFSENLVF